MFIVCNTVVITCWYDSVEDLYATEYLVRNIINYLVFDTPNQICHHLTISSSELIALCSQKSAILLDEQVNTNSIRTNTGMQKHV